MGAMRLYLASASPRRLALLREAGYEPERVAQEAAELRLPGEPAERMVQRVAREKAFSAIELLGTARPPGIVLGADTAVILDDDVLGKPASPQIARSMLARLSGRRHRVVTGVALVRTDDRREAGGVETTHVRFHEVDAQTIESYVAGGSPLDKAGAYGIQDLDSSWIAAIDGSKSNVIGLPIERIGGWVASLDP